MCVILDACPSGWIFKIRKTVLSQKKWALFSWLPLPRAWSGRPVPAFAETLLSSLQPCGACGCKPGCLSKPDVWAAHFSAAGFKSCGARCGVQTLCSSGKSSGVWAPSQVVRHTRGGAYGKIAPQPLLTASMFLSLIHPICRSFLASFFPPEQVIPYISVDCVHLWGKVSSGSASIAILTVELPSSVKCR